MTRREGTGFGDLRRRAEESLARLGVGHEADSGIELSKLLHEIDVVYAELEIQNEELRDAQGSLEASRLRYVELFEGAPLPYLVASATGDVEDVNRAAVALLGWSRPSVVGKALSVFVHAEDHARLRAHFLKAVAGAPSGATEVRLRTAAGAMRETVFHSLRLVGGETERVLTALVDVSALRAAERARAATEGRYQSLFEGSRDGLFILTTDGRVVDCNPAAVRLLGRGASDLVGREIGELFSGDVARVVRAALAGHPDDHQRVDLSIQRPDGGITVAEGAVASFLKEAQRFGYLSLHDVTERRRLEHERVVLEEQVRQLQKLDAIGRFAGGVAHDINNVLAAIMGIASTMIADAPAGSELARDLETILGASQRGREMTHGLVAFSRTEPLRPVPTELGGIVREVTALLARRTAPSVEVAVQLAPDLDVVQGEPTQLSQVVMNLCLNALEAMPAGGRLTVRLSNVTLAEADLAARHAMAPGRYVRCEVADSGHGMPPEVMQHVFEPFFTTKGVAGTGLGLSLVHGTVRQHGGFVVIESEPGAGTRVVFHLPSEPGTAPERPVRSRKLATLEGRALVVDDEPFVRKMVARSLGRLGLDALMAENGRQGVEAFEREHPTLSVVLVDLTMPDMDGVAVARAMLAIQPDMPLLLMSGYREFGVPTEILDKPTVRFLPKPFEVSELAEAVKTLVDARAAAQGPTADGPA
jgi:PAS domain S-box-containing protein